jgi:hypothetical protein
MQLGHSLSNLGFKKSHIRVNFFLHFYHQARKSFSLIIEGLGLSEHLKNILCIGGAGLHTLDGLQREAAGGTEGEEEGRHHDCRVPVCTEGAASPGKDVILNRCYRGSLQRKSCWPR